MRRLQSTGLENPLLVIAPPPTEYAVENNFCWYGESFDWFRRYLMQVCHIAQDPLWTIVPTCMCLPKRATRVSQSEAQTALLITEILLGLPTTKRVIVVGTEAYRLHMGYGSKPPGSSLWFSITAGTASKFKPVLTLPDLENIAALDRWRKTRDRSVEFRVRMNAEAMQRRMYSGTISARIRNFITEIQ